MWAKRSQLANQIYKHLCVSSRHRRNKHATRIPFYRSSSNATTFSFNPETKQQSEDLLIFAVRPTSNVYYGVCTSRYTHRRRYSTPNDNLNTVVPEAPAMRVIDKHLQDELKSVIFEINKLPDNIPSKLKRYTTKEVALQELIRECVSMNINIDDDDLMLEVVKLCSSMKENVVYAFEVFEWLSAMDIQPSFAERGISETIMLQILNILWESSAMEPNVAGCPTQLFFWRACGLDIPITTAVYNRQLLGLKTFNSVRNYRGVVELELEVKWHSPAGETLTEYYWNHMIENNVTPDLETFRNLLGSTNDVEAAMKYWTALHEHGFQPQRHEYSNMLRVASNCADEKLSRKMYEAMVEEGHEASAQDFFYMIRCAAKVSKPDAIETLLSTMSARGVPPDVHTYSVAIRSLSNNINYFEKVEVLWKKYVEADRERLKAIQGISRKAKPYKGVKGIAEAKSKRLISRSKNVAFVFRALLKSLFQNNIIWDETCGHRIRPGNEAFELQKMDYYMNQLNNEIKGLSRKNTIRAAHDFVILIYLKHRLVDKAVAMYNDCMNQRMELPYVHMCIYRNDVNIAQVFDDQIIRQFRRGIAPRCVEHANNQSLAESFEMCQKISDKVQRRKATIKLLDLCLQYKPNIDDENLIHDLFMTCWKLNDLERQSQLTDTWFSRMDINPRYAERRLRVVHQNLAQSVDAQSLPPDF